MGVRAGILALVFMALQGLVLAGDPPGGPRRLAVLPIQGVGNKHFGQPDSEVYQRVVGAFLHTRRFELMERQRMDQVLKEARFQHSGLADEGSAAELGRLLGVPWVVLGSFKGEIIAYYGDDKADNPLYRWYMGKLGLSVRLVNVETGRIQDTFEVAGAAKDTSVAKTFESLLEDTARKLERQVANTYPLAGIVVRVESPDEVLTDLGSIHGVKVGDRFAAISHGAPAIHPVTGKPVQGAKRVVANLKVLSVQKDSSLMRVSGAKAPLAEGTILESVPRKAGFMESIRDWVN